MGVSLYTRYTGIFGELMTLSDYLLVNSKKTEISEEKGLSLSSGAYPYQVIDIFLIVL